jgi:tRNA pseudouridine55 synthase
VDGFLCVNKPIGPSSFQIIDQLRRILQVKKMGHAGTLDPQASGLLLVAIGTATRLLQYVPAEPKVYQFGIQFGSQTDSLDREGVMVYSGGRIPQRAEIDAVLKKYIGEIMQMPPAFSAIKVNGVRAYKLARNGVTPELQSRAVQIFSIEVLDFDSISGIAQMQAVCSGGTYVRCLARDIAIDLGTYGFASYVHRVSIGPFSLDTAVGAELLGSAEDYIIPTEKVFVKDSIIVSDEQKKELLYGRDLLIPEFSSEIVYAFYNGELLAVLKRGCTSMYHPVTVLPANCE